MFHERIAAKSIIFLVIACILSACSQNRQLDDPIETTMQLHKAVIRDQYEEFQSLFLEQRRSHATLQLFQQLQEVKGSSADFKSYTLITFEDEMVLVNLTPNNEGKVEIQDVIFVPETIQSFFQEHLKP